MKRREIEIFSLSFLDILAGALGAVLFLFIVVPKGDGRGPASSPQLSVTYDTIQKKFFGELPDSMLQYQVGDSLLSLVINYDEMPSIKNCPEPKPCPKCPDGPKLSRQIANLKKQLAEKQVAIASLEKISKRQKAPVEKKPTKPVTKPSTKAVASKATPTSSYKGDLPSVPCKFSVEVKWDDIDQNIDLFLCKEGRCVYGGKRKRDEIGFWDSGKSKTSFFGGDLRSTQEAVRQFDSVIPGSYEIYVQYKDAKEAPLPSVPISGLVYTKTIEKGESGKTFTADIPFDKKERTLIGSVVVEADGSFTFKRE